MLTTYELARLASEPFLPYLQGKVRHEVLRLMRSSESVRANILDVGGRKSPYTIALPAKVTIIDIPRETEVQERLHLGVTQRVLQELRRRRSNIEGVVLEDMTQCTLPSNAFDGVISVEVIEHVAADGAFVRQIHRVLKPGGWLYLTTPNGDYIRNEAPHYNPDHVRHYTKQALVSLLSEHFCNVKVKYGIRTGRFRYHGLRSFDPAHPLSTAWTMMCNLINRIESRAVDECSSRTAHLFAMANKAGDAVAG